jgi:hypothetical protein
VQRSSPVSAHHVTRERTATRDIDAEIEQLIVRDVTGCARWIGAYTRQSNRPKSAILRRDRTVISVRRYLWEKKHGIKLHSRELIQHRLKLTCTHPDEYVEPVHMRRYSQVGRTGRTVTPYRTAVRNARTAIDSDGKIERRIVRDDTGCWRWVGDSRKGGKHP